MFDSTCNLSVVICRSECANTTDKNLLQELNDVPQKPNAANVPSCNYPHQQNTCISCGNRLDQRLERIGVLTELCGVYCVHIVY